MYSKTTPVRISSRSNDSKGKLWWRDTCKEEEGMDWIPSPTKDQLCDLSKPVSISSSEKWSYWVLVRCWQKNLHRIFDALSGVSRFVQYSPLSLYYCAVCSWTSASFISMPLHMLSSNDSIIQYLFHLYFSLTYVNIYLPVHSQARSFSSSAKPHRSTPGVLHTKNGFWLPSYWAQHLQIFNFKGFEYNTH